MKKKKKTNLGGWAAYPNTNVRLTTSSPRPCVNVSPFTQTHFLSRIRRIGREKKSKITDIMSPERFNT
jgi:hypothetical protein